MYQQYDFQSHSWQFSPLEAKSYSLMAVLHASFQPVVHGDGEVVSSPKKSRSLVHILGSGISGEIKVLILVHVHCV